VAICAELLDLVLPRCCIGCGAGDAAQWCPDCRVAPDVRRCLIGPDCPVPVWAAADYAGSVREALLAYKERGQRRLAGSLADLLLASVQAAAGPVEGIVVVPIPSVAAAARERGGDHMLRLARSINRQCGVSVAPVLRVSGSRDSVGLSVEQRRGRQITIRASGPVGAQSRGEVVLVDDIVTTAATIVACTKALTNAGWQVRAAAVVAQTLRRSGSGTTGSGTATRAGSNLDWAAARDWTSVAMT
jgi:predicted amidophosphoribosyltransferase